MPAEDAESDSCGQPRHQGRATPAGQLRHPQRGGRAGSPAARLRAPAWASRSRS